MNKQDWQKLSDDLNINYLNLDEKNEITWHQIDSTYRRIQANDESYQYFLRDGPGVSEYIEDFLDKRFHKFYLKIYILKLKGKIEQL